MFPFNLFLALRSGALWSAYPTAASQSPAKAVPADGTDSDAFSAPGASDQRSPIDRGTNLQEQVWPIADPQTKGSAAMIKKSAGGGQAGCFS